jgi:hypothetical protein
MKLSPDDLRNLSRALAALDDFNRGPDDRRVLLSLAGLDRFIGGLNFAAAANTFAGTLLIKLAGYGSLPENRGTHALGALLSYLLTLGDLPRESAQLFAEAIVKYSLVADETYLAKLRTDYAITIAPQRPPDAAPVRPGIAEDRAPKFDPVVPDRAALEAVIHSEDNFLDMALLIGALYCSRAVCMIERPVGTALGTGVLIGPDLLLTNQHVLTSQAMLDGAVARFDRRILDGTKIAQDGQVVPLRTDFYFASPPEELDYALVRTTGKPLEAITATDNDLKLPLPELVAQGKHRGYLPAASRFLKDRDRVNILQHPDGRPLKVVLTQNYVAGDMGTRRVQYVADTMPGSSGSPVFNANWELVALHHSGQPYPPEGLGDAAHKQWKGIFRVNEGIPMRAILEHFAQHDLTRFLPKP